MIIERTFFLLFIRNMRFVHYHIICALSNLLAFLKKKNKQTKKRVTTALNKPGVSTKTYKKNIFTKKCFSFLKQEV